MIGGMEVMRKVEGTPELDVLNRALCREWYDHNRSRDVSFDTITQAYYDFSVENYGFSRGIRKHITFNNMVWNDHYEIHDEDKFTLCLLTY